MKGDDLPDEDHVVRYAGGSLVHEDGEVDGSAFLLRDAELGLSVNWLEYYRGLTKPQQMNEVRRAFQPSRGPTARFAQLNVGDTRRHLSRRLETCRIIHDPSPADEKNEADPSHSEIKGLPPKGSPEAALIGDMIAECVVAVHPARVGD